MATWLTRHRKTLAPATSAGAKLVFLCTADLPHLPIDALTHLHQARATSDEKLLAFPHNPGDNTKDRRGMCSFDSEQKVAFEYLKIRILSLFRISKLVFRICARHAGYSIA
jgi:hypothetical protein